MRDYYAILGVDRDADAEEIKTAFRKLAMNYHPDRNPGDAWAERRFKEVNEAYETLSEEGPRAAYDATADFESSDLAETPVSEGSGWTEAPTEGEQFWRDDEPAAEPTPPARSVTPWLTATLVAASLVLVGAAIVLLALSPDRVDFDKISNRPLNAAEPAVDEARAVPSEPSRPVAPTLLNGPGADAAAHPPAAPSPLDAPAIEPAREVEDPVETEWSRIRGTRDAASLARFVAAHPGADHADEALAAATELIEAETDEARLVALLDDAPAGAVADRARARLDQLRARQRSAEDDAWEAAMRQGSAAGFRAFLEQHPSGRRAGEAKEKLEGLGLIEIAIGAGGASEKRWLRAIDAFRDCPTCPPMVVARARKTVPPDFDAKVRAALPEPYAIAKSRVSPGEWAECVRDGGCAAQPESAAAQFGLSWRDAQRYARWLRQKTGHDYRLVTELEWRYAVRLKLVAVEPGAGAARGFTGRSAVDDAPPSFADHPGERRAAPERSGLAFEWVSDCWTGDERGASGDERRDTAADAAPTPGADGLCSERVLLARRGREFERFGDTPGSGQAGYAFRVARSLE